MPTSVLSLISPMYPPIHLLPLLIAVSMGDFMRMFPAKCGRIGVWLNGSSAVIYGLLEHVAYKIEHNWNVMKWPSDKVLLDVLRATRPSECWGHACGWLDASKLDSIQRYVSIDTIGCGCNPILVGIVRHQVALNRFWSRVNEYDGAQRTPPNEHREHATRISTANHSRL
ncbi:unnamed protein product [Toxocara canis]|uniref:Transmembrane protein n=1 Tax=Toxocara canis TaxID=6265 RepID=A0A183TVK2_TOXCA|nr:unnamed protein product [Toxocara canis]